MHNLDTQPKFIKILIFNNLSIRELLKISQLNKKYNQFIKNNQWRQLTVFEEFFNKMNWKLDYNRGDMTYYHNFHIIENNNNYLMAKMVPSKKEHTVNVDINVDIDNLIVKLLNEQLDKPFVIKYHLTFMTSITNFITLDNHHEYYVKFVERYKQNKYDDQLAINICDLYEYGNLLDYIQNNHQSMNLEIWTTIFFQILYALAIIQLKYPSFRHNDLKANHIYLKKVSNNNNDYQQYYLDKQIFTAKSIGFEICIHDFHFSSISGVIENSLLNENWINKFNITSKQNQYYDMHYFFSTLTSRAFIDNFYEGVAPTEIVDFVHRIIPDKYRSNRNYPNTNVNRRGRILVNDEYTTPYQVLMNDELFTGYKK